MKATDTRRAGEACPSAETLAAFLATARSLPAELATDWQHDLVSADEQRAVTAHIATCDQCVEELRTAHRRLLLAAEIPIAVPPAIAARVTALAPENPPATAGLAAWIVGLRDRLGAALRLPVLVPAAAAIALLVVFAPRPESSTPTSREMSRSVDLRQPARVTVESAAVRAERRTDAETIATLPRGARVDLLREDDGWFRVALADGTEGWIERIAFE